MGKPGGTAQGHPRGSDPPRPGLSVQLARTQGTRRHRAEARRAAECRVSGRAGHEARRHAAEDDPAQRLQRSQGGRLAVRAHPRTGGAAALHRRWHARGQGSLFSLRGHHQPSAGGREMSNVEAELSILWPALVAGILVVLSHVPLGQQVLSRGIVFIDLAIAQVAGLGVIAAHTFGLAAGGWSTQVAAATAALAGALLLNWTERNRPEVQEALIGVLFVLASTAQILMLANDPHGGEDLKDLLAGQILWVTPAQLTRAAILTAAVLVAWFGWREVLGRTGFYVLFAVTVTVSVQLVGVYLVFT